jgi:hypothetical protein
MCSTSKDLDCVNYIKILKLIKRILEKSHTIKRRTSTRIRRVPLRFYNIYNFFFFFNAFNQTCLH